MNLVLTPAEQQWANRRLAFLHFGLGFACMFPDGIVVQMATPRPGWLTNNATSATQCVAAGNNAGLCTTLDYDTPLLFASVNVPLLCVAFFWITGTAHVLYANNAKAYFALVQRGTMWWRWVEYALSVPIMLLILCVLNGLTLDTSIVQSAALGSVTQGFGYMADYLDALQSRLHARIVHLLGYVPMVCALLPVAVSLQGIDSAPAFVPFLIVSQTCFFASFGIVQFLVLFGDTEYNSRRYAVGDTVYLVLSLACKATLAGSVVAASAVMQSS